MIEVQQRQLPTILRTYIGHLKEPLVLERNGEPYISIEPDSLSNGTDAFSEMDKIVSKTKPQDFNYKVELTSVLEKKYENLH